MVCFLILVIRDLKIIMFNRRLILIFCSVTLLFSCAKDDDTQPGGSSDDRQKFLGTWLCEETVTGGPTTTFTLEVESEGANDTIRLYNFNNLGDPFYAIGIVSGSSLVIPNQDITQVTIEGSGIYSSNKIFMNYTADSDSLSAECSR